MSAEKVVTYLLVALVLVGALNWGVHAVDPELNLVKLLTMNHELAQKVVYGLVALSAVGVIVQLGRQKLVVKEEEKK
jgi:uncharacterized membrane protein YuzA (DUF378 family)